MEENLAPKKGGVGYRILWLLGAAAAFWGTAYGMAWLAHRLNLPPLETVLLGQAPILLIALLFSLLDGDGIRSLGLTATWKGIDWAAVPLILVVHFAGSVLVGLWMQTGGGGADLKDRAITHLFTAFGQYNTGVFLLLALLLALLAGIGEEMLFRGYLITRLERLGLPGWSVIAISALAFGLLHWSGYGFIPAISKAITFGLPTGIYFWHRRRLGPLVLAHALMDYLGFLLVFVAVKLLGSSGL